MGSEKVRTLNFYDMIRKLYRTFNNANLMNVLKARALQTQRNYVSNYVIDPFYPQKYVIRHFFGLYFTNETKDRIYKTK